MRGSGRSLATGSRAGQKLAKSTEHAKKGMEHATNMEGTA
jgi:hypothetical protein